MYQPQQYRPPQQFFLPQQQYFEPTAYEHKKAMDGLVVLKFSEAIVKLLTKLGLQALAQLKVDPDIRHLVEKFIHVCIDRAFWIARMQWKREKGGWISGPSRRQIEKMDDFLNDWEDRLERAFPVVALAD